MIVDFVLLLARSALREIERSEKSAPSTLLSPSPDEPKDDKCQERQSHDGADNTAYNDWSWACIVGVLFDS
jgi:hypothetical protein